MLRHRDIIVSHVCLGNILVVIGRRGNDFSYVETRLSLAFSLQSWVFTRMDEAFFSDTRIRYSRSHTYVKESAFCLLSGIVGCGNEI